MTNKIIFHQDRCKHGMIREFCTECSGNEEAKKINKMLNHKPVKKRKPARLANGKFTMKSVNKTLNTIFVGIGLSLTVFSGYHYTFTIPETTIELKSPVGAVQAVSVPSPTPTVNPIETEIREVFGGYGDEAVEIAKCESKLDPKAYNDNRTWGGVGVDRGLFQQNSVYHPADKKFVEDPSIAIRMAYQIFKEAGYSWTPWTCRYIFDK